MNTIDRSFMRDAGDRRPKRKRAIAAPGLRTLERHVEQSCSELLQLDGWRTLKTDPVSDRARGKGFGELGMADRLYLRYRLGPKLRDLGYSVEGHPLAEVIWIEWKRVGKSGKATKATQHQLDWHAAERATGAYTYIAGVDFPATFEGFKAWYMTSGYRVRVR